MALGPEAAARGRSCVDGAWAPKLATDAGGCIVGLPFRIAAETPAKALS